MDDRIKVVPLNGEVWSSYQKLNDMNLLDDVRTIPWDQGGDISIPSQNHPTDLLQSVHPQLQFVSHLMSNVYGEQFISQLFRGMPDQQWLFKYGRVPMSILLSEYIWKVGFKC